MLMKQRTRWVQSCSKTGDVLTPTTVWSTTSLAVTAATSADVLRHRPSRQWAFVRRRLVVGLTWRRATTNTAATTTTLCWACRRLLHWSSLSLSVSPHCSLPSASSRTTSPSKSSVSALTPSTNSTGYITGFGRVKHNVGICFRARYDILLQSVRRLTRKQCTVDYRGPCEL